MSYVPKLKMGAVAPGDQNLNQLKSSYTYSVVFIEIILETEEDDAKSIKDLVVYCPDQGISAAELKNFQQKYR